MIQTDISIVLPEVVLAVFAMVALLVVVYTGKDAMARLTLWVTSAVFVLLAAWIGLSGEATNIAFNGMFVDDGLHALPRSPFCCPLRRSC